ncbi:uncharacterized protein F4822DRAFT_421029 [Hypoxylon trugodes]|uniref:uncharacterized protein n=1 Tax=Hypoxylon trugodes TaxID=326681 RepID=UPI00219151DA|nr:uncharacterized protein F4822DRAFT_421029 [Hypoxylon trugodes]KAI1383566.1 hypothetical protein F4822DRAFT_421029 [Hypoxylon trugodes]
MDPPELFSTTTPSGSEPRVKSEWLVQSTPLSALPTSDSATPRQGDRDGTHRCIYVAPIRPDPDTLEAESHESLKTHETGTKDRTNDPDYLEQLVTHDGLEALEAGAAIRVTLLNQLEASLSTVNAPAVSVWLNAVEELEKSAEPARTVIGVVGNTGGGKSSIINSILDEERLLPTNCLRACTASPTEISFNHSEDPSELYRAEVEFLTKQEWVSELEVLFSDLFDGNGEILREYKNAESEAGVAFAKLRAVYPHKTKEMIVKGTPESFANEPAVRGVLGDTKVLKDKSAKSIYGRLQHYVDSKEKVTRVGSRKSNVQMEYWPLIKVVRIYTKADALSTGAVIVDLPGVQDSNAARAAVAQKYMKSCTGLWIVAPITRAVDDKTAKSLLGDSFKRQLKYDGAYSAVSFICSKTDDISITEAVDSLDLEEEIGDLSDKADQLETSKVEAQERLDQLEDEKSQLKGQIEDLENKVELWEDMAYHAWNGKEVYAPEENARKRKRAEKLMRSRKNRGAHRRDDDEEYSENSDSYGSQTDKEGPQLAKDRQKLTEEQVEEKLLAYKKQRRETRDEYKVLSREITDMRKQIEKEDIEYQKISNRIKGRCIRERNEYSRAAIKQDFAAGIKELDQENAMEEDDTGFDPDQDIRDYDEVARNLHVFCVSSRAYQKLSGTLLKDDTEIPQLQQHAKKITEVGRANACRKFLNGLTRLINSMKIWVGSDGSEATLSDVEKRIEEIHLRKLLEGLEKNLNAPVEEVIQLLKQALSEHIYHVFDSSIPLAVDAAVGTANSWGASKSAGGIVWATYKAIVRRNGVFQNSSGIRDFNQELFEPVGRNLTTGWERAFQRRFPTIFDEFVSKAKMQLESFHEAAKARSQKHHINIPRILTLSHQLQTHTRMLESLPATLYARTNELQRGITRQFCPSICMSMTPAYVTCTAEKGLGCYARMKEAMEKHVERSRHTMFKVAVDTVKEQLDDLCDAIEKGMADHIEGISSAIFRDYAKVLVGITVDWEGELPSEELVVRARVNATLEGCNAMFASAFTYPNPKQHQVQDPAGMEI